MTPTLRLGLLGVVALALGLVAGPLFLLSGSPGPSASPTPTPTSTIDRLPAELTWWWTRPPMNLPEMGPDQYQATLDLTSGFMAKLVVGDDESDILSAGILKDTGQLRVLNNSFPANGCAKNTVGIYDWRVTEDGHRLTLDGTDDCAHRATYLNGEWQLFECAPEKLAHPGLNRGWTCEGLLAAGTHGSEFFRPQAEGAPSLWTTTPGGLTVTVPDGWANWHDFESGYVLVPASEYDPTYHTDATGVPDPLASSISVLARPVAIAPGDPCTTRPQPGVGRDAASLADWIAGHDGVVLTDRSTITVDGHEAIVLDVDLAPGWTAFCDAWGYTSRPNVVPVGYGSALKPEGGFMDNTAYWEDAILGPLRMILLDLGPDDPMLIEIWSSDPAKQAAFVEQAMPIVESLHFAD